MYAASWATVTDSRSLFQRAFDEPPYAAVPAGENQGIAR